MIRQRDLYGHSFIGKLAALALPNVGYATNADHGAGCNIHPPGKQVRPQL